MQEKTAPVFVVAALYRAFDAGRELGAEDLHRCATDLVPLYRTYEERVKALRAWAKNRARPAGRQDRVLDLLRGLHHQTFRAPS